MLDFIKANFTVLLLSFFIILFTGITLLVFAKFGGSKDAVSWATSAFTKTTLYTPAQDGTYRFMCGMVETQAATVSAIRPTCVVYFTDPSISTESQVNALNTSSANALANAASGTVFFAAKSGAAISYKTEFYSSTGATPMQYSVRIKLEKLP